MKTKSLILAATAAITTVSSAYADADIRVTGSTAFRASALSAILRAFGTNNPTTNGNITTATSNATVAYSGSNYSSASQAIIRGTFPGISGTTTVRTSWSGSIEGVRSIVNFNNSNGLNPYIPTTQTGTTMTVTTDSGTGSVSFSGGTSGVSTSSSVSLGDSKIAFSDVNKNSSPYKASTFTGGPVGAITFVPFIAKGSNSNITNVNDNQLRTIAASGFLPVGNLTGIQTDITALEYAYWTGRNDGSGTRSVVLTESQYGDKGNKGSNANPVEQYRINSTAVIQRWPVGDGNNASIIFNADSPANGGYSSGGTLRTAFGNGLAAAVQVLDETGVEQAPAAPLSMLTVVSTEDAGAALGNTTSTATNRGTTSGGRYTSAGVLSWNGVSITPITAAGGGLSPTDIAKVANGSYTFWSFEQLYGYQVSSGTTGAAGPDLTAFFNKLLTDVKLDSNVGGSGLTLTQMSVDRATDGATITDK